jgi:hypothetical protein
MLYNQARSKRGVEEEAGSMERRREASASDSIELGNKRSPESLQAENVRTRLIQRSV